MRDNKVKYQQGFTLIELMIVVAIIGLLATVALPAYQTYTIKAKLTEAILASNDCRASVTEYHQTYHTLPDVGEAGCNRSSNDTTNLINQITQIENGVIQVQLIVDSSLGAASNGSITFTPNLNSLNNIELWICRGTDSLGNAGAIDTFLPYSCRP